MRTSEEIADILQAEIEAGAWRPGERWPRDADVAERFGCSIPTAGRVKHILQGRGLLVRRDGRDRFVRG